MNIEQLFERQFKKYKIYFQIKKIELNDHKYDYEPTDFHWVHNQKENSHYDHIPLNFESNQKYIFVKVYIYIFGTIGRLR